MALRVLVLVLAGCGTPDREQDGDAPVDSDTGSDPPVVDDDDDDDDDADDDGATDVLDCVDDDPAVHPGAHETCNGVDDDCDGDVDEEPIDGFTWYTDADGDRFGTAESAWVSCEADEPDAADQAGDCDDADPERHPARDEACNGIDDDCDPATLEVDLISTRASYGWRNHFDLQDAVTTGEGPIQVCPGTYGGFTIDTTDPPMDLVATGGPDVTFLEQSAFDDDATVVVGTNGLAPVGDPVTMTGFTFLGRPDSWRPMLLVDQSEPNVTLNDCRFVGAGEHGGAITIARQPSSTGAIRLVDVVFDGVSGSSGAAIRMESGFAPIDGTRLSFLGTRGSYFGGAVHIAADFTCRDCTFEDNEVAEAVGYARGAAIYANHARVVLERSRFAGNSGAAAIYLNRGSLDATDSTFVHNVGGAIDGVHPDAITLTGGVVDGNVADPGGAAVYLHASDGVTLVATDVDFGFNDPDDVVVDTVSGVTGFSYDGVVSFGCTDAGCAP